MEINSFTDYFTDNIEYPSDIAINPLPIGKEYIYVSSTFLNGFINYVTPIKAFVLGRYHKWDEPIDHTVTIQDPPGSFNWVEKKCKTKDELYNSLIVSDAVYHVGVDNDFQDDVLILAKAGQVDGEGECYFFFWYDRDCSDCCIGRFISQDLELDIINRFTKYINKELAGNNYNAHGAKEIPLNYFKGWITG